RSKVVGDFSSAASRAQHLVVVEVHHRATVHAPGRYAGGPTLPTWRQPQCAGRGLVLSSRRGLQPARPVLSGQGSAGGRAKRALDRTGSVWLPPGALRGEGQPGPCLSEAVPGAGQSPAGVRGSAPATPGRAAAGSRG